ncbi:hypothetical protein Psi02_65000 [Planotetraspora silvatica]|uniref:LLM class flavin-dependent oxidoreductase n=1 Tax=Planotetraspora silvatica TaxID=234614 RepID=A0A8J3XS30_9ACTN|nr:LLM class flavin-dependent oxidoreductase [Planotetraspora silvatica]GII50076.1 hypothetical protein Psi02_65000 [Planotetraspora silvatica]
MAVNGSRPPVLFGVSVTPDAAAIDEITNLTRIADAAGLALLGDHHRIRGYQPGPPPTREIGLWVGAQKPRMLRLIGHLADGWVCPLNIYISPDEVPPLQEIIDGAASDAGRDPNRIRRIYNVLGRIGPETGGQGLNGPVEMWAETLADWAARLRFDTFVFWPTAVSAASATQFRVYAEEVVPRVRALLDED